MLPAAAGPTHHIPRHRLAAGRCCCNCHTVLKANGWLLLQGEGLMFLFTDSQIVDERMLVYINDLLSSGEIPDLFAQEDKDEIVNAMRSETKAMGLVDTTENCWATFIQKARLLLLLLWAVPLLPHQRSASPLPCQPCLQNSTDSPQCLQ